MCNTTEEQKVANAIMKSCGCECHEPGVAIMHFMACCQHCYETNTDLLPENKEDQNGNS